MIGLIVHLSPRMRSHFSAVWKNNQRFVSPSIRRPTVNALGGLFSFLPSTVMQTITLVIMCQCPRRALLISTPAHRCRGSPGILCVNALGGLFSFLPGRCNLQTSVDENGINALGGLFSFLPRFAQRLIVYLRGGVNALGGLFSFLHPDCKLVQRLLADVSMPSAGSSHFYLRLECGYQPVDVVCQCPRVFWRAIFPIFIVMIP